MKDKKTFMLMKKYKILYVFLFAIVCYYFLFHYIPIFMGIIMSFKDMKIGGNIFTANFVGFDNYRYIFESSELVGIIMNTLEISLLRLVFGFVPPIILAIFIFDMVLVRAKKVCQTIVYIPHFFSWVIIYGIVQAFFSGTGFINNLVNLLGGERFDFLMSSDWFRPILIGSALWRDVGWNTILYFAALVTVNPELYEAAKIDGAGPWRRTTSVTLPTILPIIVFSLIMSIGNILNVDFEQILMFYNAAVYDVADVIDTWVYRVGLGKMEYGIGAAVGLLKAIVSFILIAIANTFSKKVSGRGLW